MTARNTPKPAAAHNEPQSNGKPVKPTAPAVTPKSKKSRPSPYAGENDLVMTANESGRLDIFARAVITSGLDNLLAQNGPFTVFAPTDRAFGRLPKSELEALLADSALLARVLGHHVVPGRVKAPTLDNPRLAMPVFGDELTLTRKSDAFRVDEARLVRTNMRAKNGVIHAIDRVLMPADGLAGD